MNATVKTQTSEQMTASLKQFVINTPVIESTPQNNAENLAPETIASDDIDYSTMPDFPPTEHAPPVKKPLFTSLADMMANRKIISWLIRDYLPLDSTCMLLAESGAGKTFLAIDMGLSIATGNDWQGHKVKQGAVFYVAGEGQSGITSRINAWCIKHGVTFDNVPFYCSSGAVLLPDKNNLIELMSNIEDLIKSTGHEPALMVFDTMARCFVGEENSAKETGAYIQAMDTIRQAFGCCVLNLHHTGKDTSKGGRGSSALKGACDIELTLSNAGAHGANQKILEMTKSKETEPQPPKFFTLESVATNWLNDDGNVIYSAVLQSHEGERQKKSHKLPHNTKKMLDCLRKLTTPIDEYSGVAGIATPQIIKDLFPDSPEKIPDCVVLMEEWEKAAYEVMTVTTKADKPNINDSDAELIYLKAKKDAQRMAFKRGYERLEKEGYIGLLGDYVWNAVFIDLW